MPRVSELPWLASERRGATCARAEICDQRFHRSRQAKHGSMETAVSRGAENNRRGIASRNSTAVAFHGERRSRLSRAWPFGENIERRRIQRFVWPRSLAPICVACSMCWTSRQSVCIRAIIFGCSTRSRPAKEGNSLVIVEHDDETMRRADHVVDLGPRAGATAGSRRPRNPARYRACENSETGRCLKTPLCHPIRKSRRALRTVENWIEFAGLARTIERCRCSLSDRKTFRDHRYFQFRKIDIDA